MKVWEILGIIVGIGAIIQFNKWILDTLKISESVGDPFTFLLSSIFTLLILIIIILTQLYQEVNKIKAFLNKQNIQNKTEDVQT